MDKYANTQITMIDRTIDTSKKYFDQGNHIEAFIVAHRAEERLGALWQYLMHEHVDSSNADWELFFDFRARIKDWINHAKESVQLVENQLKCQ